jgi:hypothetical protein
MPRTSPGRPRRPAASGGWLRALPARALVAAMLAVSLLLGGAVLVVDTLRPSPSDALDHPDRPVTDDQSQAQVLEPAKRIVSVNRLETTSAGYMLMSCKDRKDPPYQGAIYLTFKVPTSTRADAYLGGIATDLASHGWAEGLPPNGRAFGRIFSRDAVTVTMYRHDDDPGLGVLRIYGECRNVNDHRGDMTTWIDITGRLNAA